MTPLEQAIEDFRRQVHRLKQAQKAVADATDAYEAAREAMEIAYQHETDVSRQFKQAQQDLMEVLVNDYPDPAA